MSAMTNQFDEATEKRFNEMFSSYKVDKSFNCRKIPPIGSICQDSSGLSYKIVSHRDGCAIGWRKDEGHKVLYFPPEWLN